MANNKATAEGSSQLSDELDGIVQKLVKQASGSNNSITEDDIRLAINDRCPIETCLHAGGEIMGRGEVMAAVRKLLER